jgi:hypothetical protein
MRYVFRRHLFLLIGLLTLCLFFLVAELGETAHALAGPMRVLIVPMYLVWMVTTIAQVAIVGPFGLPFPFAAVVWGISLAAGLAPYALADFVLNGWRLATIRKVSANVSSGALDGCRDASRKEGRSEKRPME